MRKRYVSGVLKACLFCYTLFMTWTDEEDSGVPVTAATAGVQMLKRQVGRLLWAFRWWEPLVLSVDARSVQLCVCLCLSSSETSSFIEG
jgi:hypothetical protein